MSAFKVWKVTSILGLAFPFFCCCCVFQPSWAKGWPGLSQKNVFATAFAISIFLGVFGAGGILCQPESTGRPDNAFGWRSFWIRLSLTVVAGLLTAAMGFLIVFQWDDLER
jgi:hypothetical protein